MSPDLTIRPLSGAQAGAEAALAPHPFRTHKTPDAAQKFEAFVLQTFIQEMMPKTAEGVFGSGLAGDFWRSLLSEKIAEQVAERGSLGIADVVRTGDAVPVRPGGFVPIEVLARISTLGADATALEESPISGD